jgi:hypothetical protein
MPLREPVDNEEFPDRICKPALARVGRDEAQSATGGDNSGDCATRVGATLL